MTRVLDFLGLDLDGYDFAAADDLPVKGSSVFGRSDDGVHWNPVQKDASFQPLKRFEHWTDKQHARFDWLAGEQLVRLGYEPRSWLGIRKVRTETDREPTKQWYVQNIGYRIVGTNPKKHTFSLPDVDVWTVLGLDLEE